MRKNFFLLLFTVAGYFAFGQKPVPYLQTPTSSSIWVNWRTETSLDSKVLYGLSESILTNTASGSTQALTDPVDNYTKNYYYHGVQLKGLQPNTRYFYKVVSDAIESEVYSFKTQPVESSQGIYRFLILGDHQLFDDRYERLMKAAKAKCEQKYGTPIENHINMITNVGDQVDVGTLKHYEQVHFAKSESLSPNLPIMTIVGNHETYGTLGLNAYNAHYFYDSIEYKGIRSGSEFYYAFQVGRALFLMLSSESMHTNNTQLNWAAQVIEAAKADPNIDWIFSYNHRPLQAEQYIGDISKWVVEKIMPLLNTTEKSVMNVSGHHHLYHRGQLRDHPTYHIITGGAAWDQRWGQSTEQDFDDVQKTIDYWPFQIVELNSATRTMNVETYVIGNQVETLDSTTLVDIFSRTFGQPKPSKPSVQALVKDMIQLPYTFTSSPYSTTSSYEYNSVQFQVSASTDFSKLEFDLIRDYENIYGAHPPKCQLVDLNAGVNIFEQTIASNKLFNGKHYIRVRHRDRNVEWSDWSEPVSFVITGSLNGETTLISSKDKYAVGEQLSFNFANATNESGQWIGIYKESQTTPSASSNSVTWKSASGEAGTVTFTVANPGVYYAAIFKDGGYEIMKKTDLFYIGTTPVLNSDKSKYEVGETVKINFTNAPKLTGDWIGIYKMGHVPGPIASTAWNYITAATNDTLKIQSANLKKGYYFATYLMQEKYFEPSERIFIQIGDEISSLAVKNDTIKLSDTLSFSFENGPGTPKDYVGIYKEGDVYGVDELATYLYVYGEVGGEVKWVNQLPAGNYYAYLFTNDSYDAVSNKVNLTILSSDYWIDEDLSTFTVEADYIQSVNTINTHPNDIALERNYANFETLGGTCNDNLISGNLLRIRGKKDNGYLGFKVKNAENIRIALKAKSSSADRTAEILINGRVVKTFTGLDADHCNVFDSIIHYNDSLTVIVRGGDANSTNPICINRIQVTKYVQSQSLSRLDSLVAVANAKIEANYTIPSFTELKRNLVAAQNSPDSLALVNNLENAIGNLKIKEMPYNIVMNIYQDPSTKMAFNWFTNKDITDGKVQIVQGTATNASAFALPLMTLNAKCIAIDSIVYTHSRNDLANIANIPNSAKRAYTENKAVATGLTPGTTYSFRVGTEGAWSEIGTFTTAKANKDAFSFIYTTDPQANTYEMFDISQRTTHAAFNKYPNTDFWLHCGDLVESSGASNSEWEWEQLFETQQDLFLKQPFAPIQGNHDNSANRNFAHHFNTDSVSFDRNMANSPGSVYSYVYNDVLFLALNFEDYSKAGYLDSLANWMKQEVAKHPDTKWRIAYGHKSIYTGSTGHQSDSDGKTVRDKIAPIYDSLKIDIALEGHDHIYEVMGPIYNKQLVEGAVSNQQSVSVDARENVKGKFGGIFDTQKGTLYLLNNSSGKKKYEPRTQEQMEAAQTAIGIEDYFSLFTGRFGQTGRPTFSNVAVFKDTITISTYEVFDNDSVGIFDEFKVVKSVDVASVTLDQHTLDLFIDSSLVLTATILPENATNKNVNWESSDTSIATVDGNGTVKGITTGTVLIIVTTEESSLKDTCTVTILENPVIPLSIFLNQHTLSLKVDSTQTLTATVLPEDAVNKNFTWSSNNTSVATVDNNGLVKGIVAGTALIIATTEEGELKDSCTVTVSFTTSIGDNVANQTDLKLYPNPASGQLTVESSDAIRKVTFYSTAGQLVKAVAVSNVNKITINVESLPSGIYTVYIHLKDHIEIRKVVIK